MTILAAGRPIAIRRAVISERYAGFRTMTISGEYSARASGETISCPVPATNIPCLRGFKSTTRRMLRAPGTKLRKVTPFEPAPQKATVLCAEVNLFKHSDYAVNCSIEMFRKRKDFFVYWRFSPLQVSRMIISSHKRGYAASIKRNCSLKAVPDARTSNPARFSKFRSEASVK